MQYKLRISLETKENEHDLLRCAFTYGLFSIKIKSIDNKIASGFIQTQQYIIVFYLDDMFRSLDHHQAVFTKLKNMVHAVQITFMQYGIS